VLLSFKSRDAFKPGPAVEQLRRLAQGTEASQLAKAWETDQGLAIEEVRLIIIHDYLLFCGRTYGSCLDSG
jgi:hypothetical protein